MLSVFAFAGGLSVFCRKGKGKPAPLSRPAFSFHISAVSLHNPLNHGQSQAGMIFSLSSGSGRIRPVKSFPDMGKMFCFNPDSIIFYASDNFPAGA